MAQARNTAHISARSRRVLRRLTAHSEEIAVDLMDAIRSGSPAYGRIRDHDLLERFVDVSSERLHMFGRWVDSGGLLTEGDRDALRAGGVLTAQSLIPLDAMIDAVRAAQRSLWTWITEACGEDHAGKAAALELVRLLVGFVDETTAEATAAYLDVKEQVVADDARLRRDVLEELLSGRPQTARRGLSDLGFSADEATVVLVAAPDDRADREGLQAVYAALDVALPKDAPRLLVVRFDELVGLVAVRGSVEVREIVEAAMTTAQRVRGIDVVAGLSSISTNIDDVPRRYEEAHKALEIAATQPGRVAALPDVPLLDQLVLQADFATVRSVSGAVWDLMEEDAAQGGALVRTLLAFVEADMSAAVAAQELVVHPNTVHYRLKRIREITGRDTRAFNDLVDLVLSVRLVHNGMRRGWPDGGRASIRSV